MTVPAVPSVDAPEIQVFGAAYVTVARTFAGTYYPLGFTRNGVDQTEEAFWLDIPGDEYGGDDGPPIDVQYLGQILRIRCELTKWNIANVNMVRARIEDSGVGTPLMGEGYLPCTYIGVPVIQSGAHFSLAIAPGCTPLTPYYTYIFPIAIPRAPMEINHATKFATMTMEFECHRVPSNAAVNAGRIFFHTLVTP